MKDNIALKGNKYGLTLYINEEMQIDNAKEELIKKLTSAKHFLNNGTISIAFEGKKLSIKEEQEFAEIINDNSNVNVMCIIDTANDKKFHIPHEPLLDLESSKDICMHKGNISAGETLEAMTSVIVIGDVCTGGNIISAGNIIVLGSLLGNAYAGTVKDESSYVVAYSMEPKKLRIGNVSYKATRYSYIHENDGPKIAFLKNGNIHIKNII